MTESSASFVDRMRISGNPVADTAAQVRVGAARFTVLTTRLVRMEFAPDGNFEDRGSYAFPNRQAAVPSFRVHTEDDSTVIDTGDLVVTYTPDGQPFHSGNLNIELTDGPVARWTPGLRDKHNLGGARRTIDMCRGDATLEHGLVSRSGWALVDDSTSILFGEDGWVRARGATTGTQDWYFFGYGHDYATAVRDYVHFGGAVPLVPRWMLGSWWSRYWAYRDTDLRELVEEFTARELPLDVLVIDMDWHLPNSWTGYSWNRELFPDPRGFLTWLHERGLHTTLNLHPALGVQVFEDSYRDFVTAMQLDIEGTESTESIPFDVGNPDYMRNYFELLHHPLEDEGVDFWWMDWQQGRSSDLAGIDPLPWLNHLHFTDMLRHPDMRPVTFSRWGGLGSHRYPIGFSGDSFAYWSALQFQPRYTAAGANVGYGWWSHDIGGHVGPDEPELYVRWVQFGALSPILRLHSNQHAESERRPWMFGDDALTAAREAFDLRYELMPYLYTAAKTAADTGIAPVRPMSWLAPEDDSSYAARFQYQLGDSLVVAPVVHPAEPTTGLASVDVWLPAGEWIERSTYERFSGPRWVRQVADLFQVPQFVRVGSVLPLTEIAPTTGQQPTNHLVLSVFPGADGNARVYEDDGTSSAFMRGDSSWTTVHTSTPTPSHCTVTIDPSTGAGDRRYTVRFEGTHRPAAVTLDGEPLDGWHHDANVTVVNVPARPRTSSTTVTVTAYGELDADLNPAVRDADLRRLLGSASASVDDVRALEDAHPARAVALARIGGPLLRIFEYTAPDEAQSVFGRAVVAAGPGESVQVEAHWRIERGGRTDTVDVGPFDVLEGGSVLDAPFGWDDSRSPTRWSVDLVATWGDVVVRQLHRSAVVMPSISSWRLAVVEEDRAPGVETVLAGTDQLGWRTFESDPFDIDFPELTQRYDLPLQHDPAVRPDLGYIVFASSVLDVAHNCEIALSYFSSDAVEVYVDGERIVADVTGIAPTTFYDPDPQPRRTADIALDAGRHALLMRCTKQPELHWPQWCLSVAAVASDGSPALAVTNYATG